MANVINSLKLGSGTYVFTTPYATCDTPSTTVEKVATITPGSNFSLETGARVAVKFTEANTVAVPTLNVNSTGGKVIYFKNAGLNRYNSWSAGQIVEFIYDGNGWVCSAVMTDTDTKNTAGSTDTSSKIFLIGATSQAANPQTYSHDTVYIGANGCLTVEDPDGMGLSVSVTSTGFSMTNPVGSYDYGLPVPESGNTATIALTSDIPDVSNFVTPNVLNASLDNYVDISSAQEISGKKTFTGGVQFGTGTVFNNGGIQIPAANAFKVMGTYDVSLPSKTGTLALTSDLDLMLTNTNIFTGYNYFDNPVSCRSGINATNGTNLLDSASLKYNCINRYTNDTNYTLTIPAKNGTLALTSDITDTKNTAGATDTSSLLYLIGATTQTANPQTYSHDTLYIDGSGRLHNVAANTSVSVQNTIRLDPVNQHVLVGTGGLGSEPENYAQYGTSSIICKLPTGNAYSYYFPAKTGTLALTSDIPSGGGSGGCILDDLETEYKESIRNEEIENVNAVPVLDVEGMGNWTMVPVSELGGGGSGTGTAKYLHHLYITGSDERVGNFAICAMHVNNSNTPINTYTQLLSELALRRMMATGYCGSTNSTYPVYCLERNPPSDSYITIHTVSNSGDLQNDIGSYSIPNGGIIDSVLPI